MPDSPYSRFAQAAMGGLRKAAETVSPYVEGAQYLLAPTDLQRIGNAEQGSLGMGPMAIPREGQTLAQAGAEAYNRRRPVKSLYEEVTGRPKPAWTKYADIAADLVGDPLQNGPGGGLGGAEAVTRIMPGASKVVQQSVRSNQALKGLERAREVFSPANVKAFEEASTYAPRVGAHVLPEQADEFMMEALGHGAGFSPGIDPTHPRAGTLTMAADIPRPTDSAIHELAHAAQRLWKKDFPDLYQKATAKFGYWLNPYEVSARATEKFQPFWRAQKEAQPMLPGSRPVLRDLARAEAQHEGQIGKATELAGIKGRSQRIRQQNAQRRFEKRHGPEPTSQELPFDDQGGLAPDRGWGALGNLRTRSEVDWDDLIRELGGR